MISIVNPCIFYLKIIKSTRKDEANMYETTA
jgi:hypothetical protein